MKKLFLFAIIIVAVLGCEQENENKEPTASQVQTIPDPVLDFAKQHNAIVGWDTLDIFATVQFEEMIMNKKRPLLINDILFWFHDINKTDGTYRFLFSTKLNKYYFDLECDSLQKTEILSRVKQVLIFDMMAIVEIQNVKKINHIIESEFIEENSQLIDLNLGYTNSFILKGKLIDLLNN